MEFIEILEKYEDDIKHANRMLNPECLSFFKKSEDYWNGYKKACYNWFQLMKEYTHFIPQTRKPNEEELQMIYIDNGISYEPVSILEYRGEEIPVYCDDYGQQEFIIYKGNIYNGGAYNITAEYDFCAFIDNIKDNIE